MRVVDPQRPARIATHGGLAYALWLPEGAPRGAMVVLHGAGSCKERHFDVARAAQRAGFVAVAFDQRGHGESDGALGAGALDDVAAMTALAREAAGGAAVALRGSSMGGWMALAAAGVAAPDAIVAICPAPSPLLLRGLDEGRFEFRADRASLEALLLAYDLHQAVQGLTVPLLLLHARGDASVPVQHSRDLAELRPELVDYVEVPGGHHSSVQHDPELQGVTLGWLARRFAPTG